jgi:Zn-finger protein
MELGHDMCKMAFIIVCGKEGEKKRIFCHFRFYFLIEKKSRRKLGQIWKYSVIGRCLNCFLIANKLRRKWVFEEMLPLFKVPFVVLCHHFGARLCGERKLWIA